MMAYQFCPDLEQIINFAEVSEEPLETAPVYAVPKGRMVTLNFMAESVDGVSFVIFRRWTRPRGSKEGRSVLVFGRPAK